nr:hypothetical protein [Glaciibacter superstes]
MEGVIDEETALEQFLVIGLDIETAKTDRQKTGASRIGIQVAVDIGGVHDPRQRAGPGLSPSWYAANSVSNVHHSGSVSVAGLWP